MNTLDTYYAALTSEQSNPLTTDIDMKDTAEILQLINQQDQQVADAVAKVIPSITTAVDIICQGMRNGGRLVYVGAGTSGRLGVLDASECPPTFRTPPELVQGFIAGGDGALRTAVEGAEDNAEAGAALMESLHLTPNDTIVGITASGSARYVIGAIEAAKNRGCKTVAVVTNPNTLLAQLSDVSIEPLVGPEVITGSTRMKSGTAQKMVLNMLTTATMIKLGKVYYNMMVDLRATNQKLKHRALRTVINLTGADSESAQHALDAANGHVKLAIVMLKAGLNAEHAQEALHKHEGHLRKTLMSLQIHQ